MDIERDEMFRLTSLKMKNWQNASKLTSLIKKVDISTASPENAGKIDK
jgi:hypothetical protein